MYDGEASHRNQLDGILKTRFKLKFTMIKRIYSKAYSIYRQALFPYTPASLRRKVIFIHIPKAAGTSVRLALGEPKTGRQHLPWWVYYQASTKRFNKFFKFAFVRNPLDRAVSGYNYLKSGGNQMEDLLVAQQIEKYQSFGEFVSSELVAGSMIYHPVFRPQCWYLCDWKGEIQVDYVGKFESINKDFQSIVDRLGITDFDGLKVENKSKNNVTCVDKSTKTKIYNLYSEDYKLFGYDF